VTLAVLAWSLTATGAVAYYYLEQARLAEQLREQQQSMNMLVGNYDTSTTKRNLLAGDYSNLFGEYQSSFTEYEWLPRENCSILMDKFSKLLVDLQGNYSLLLNEFPELNTTYNKLLDNLQSFGEKITVAKEEFGVLLNDFHRLFAALATKEMDGYLGQINEIKVSLCIDYGNQTAEWHNTTTFPGTTLFDLTRETAEVEYSYWPTMEPGHMLINSINNCSEGYWIWHYWDEAGEKWVFGPVGCDAWLLRDKGIYNWTCVR